MKQGFYFRFYRKFHNEALCFLLAELAYFLYCIVFFVKKLTAGRKSVTLDEAQAQKLIDEVYPKPESYPSYENKKIDDNVDLSIIVPVYNYADILENNIKSILNQKTKYNFEVIFVDDGSTDGAAEILRKYESNPRVKLIFQQNGGIGAARNTGINMSSGRYLMFVDCDDIVHEDMVELLLSEAEKGGFDMVCGAHNLVKEQGGEVYDVIPNVYPSGNLMGYKNGDEIMNLPGLPWSKVYKRELWNNVRFFPGYWYEDTIIQFLIFTQCKSYKYIDKAVYDYKWYEKNFSHTQGDSARIKTIDRYWLTLEIIEKYIQMGLPTNDSFYTLVLRHFSAYYYTSVSNLKPEIVESLFVLAKSVYDRYKPDRKVKLPYMLRQVEKAFDTENIELWKLSSLYQ